jgi:hypothetical protein
MVNGASPPIQSREDYWSQADAGIFLQHSPRPTSCSCNRGRRQRRTREKDDTHPGKAAKHILGTIRLTPFECQPCLPTANTVGVFNLAFFKTTVHTAQLAENNNVTPLIAQRSQVQILPQQPIKSSSYEEQKNQFPTRCLNYTRLLSPLVKQSYLVDARFGIFHVVQAASWS